MHLLASALLLLVATAALAASADAPAQGNATDTPHVRTNLDVVVPVPPVEHERLHFFAPRDRHVVPGTVTINKAPYECDLDHVTFRDREQFVAHLRSAHRISVDRIPDTLVVIDGRVHFVGE